MSLTDEDIQELAREAITGTVIQALGELARVFEGDALRNRTMTGADVGRIIRELKIRTTEQDTTTQDLQPPQAAERTGA